MLLFRRLRLILACLVCSLAFAPPAVQLDIDRATAALVSQVTASRAGSTPLSVAGSGTPVEAALGKTARAVHRGGDARGRGPNVAPLAPVARSQRHSWHGPGFDGRQLYLEHRSLLC